MTARSCQAWSFPEGRVNPDRNDSIEQLQEEIREANPSAAAKGCFMYRQIYGYAI
jgi:hypothetical protein